MNAENQDVQKIKQTIKDANDLIEKAIWIVDGPPYYFMGWEGDPLKLSVDGDIAVLVVFEDASDGYGGHTMDQRTVRFPVDILAWSDQAITKWKADEIEITKQKQAALDAARRKENEAKERAEYERLKAKFGE